MKRDINIMKLSILSQKAGLFKDLLDCIEKITTEVQFTCDDDGLSLQCMDSSHAMLVDLNVPGSWFTAYNAPQSVTWGTSLKELCAVLGCRAKKQTIHIDVDPETDKIFVAFLDGDDTDIAKEFEINQYDFDSERLAVPDDEHDVDLSVDSVRFGKLLTELESFGGEVQINCTDEAVRFKSREGPVSMSATLPQSDMTDYALPEEGVSEVFASSYLLVAASFAKLSKYATVPRTMDVHLNRSRPAHFRFVLGEGENPPVVEAIVAPRMGDDDSDCE